MDKNKISIFSIIEIYKSVYEINRDVSPFGISQNRNIGLRKRLYIFRKFNYNSARIRCKLNCVSKLIFYSLLTQIQFNLRPLLLHLLKL